MQSFKTNDSITLKYTDTGASSNADAQNPWLILIHGFTGSSLVWQHSIPRLSQQYRVIVPDLRGHGDSDKPRHGYQVMRLAMDLRELIVFLSSQVEEGRTWRAIGGSLGCSIIWAYASLFTTHPFTHTIFIDQSPLQNTDLEGWSTQYSNRGMNSPLAVASLQATLQLSPATAHKGTISACLSYRSHPLPNDTVSAEKWAQDEEFFLKEALRGDGWWLGKLMADHTALDWRDAIRATFGDGSGSQTKVLVLASSRSGCFPSEGPMKVVDLVNKGCEEGKRPAEGTVVDWGGHWLYWENPGKFEDLALSFLEK